MRRYQVALGAAFKAKVALAAVKFTERLEQSGVAISRDGKGRALANAFIERLWRCVKKELVHHEDCQTRAKARQRLFE